ncbi:MAG TPA: DinB family protein [Candidatus Krumholzibacteria bacterium]|nr:DinB family protein [Candidatus Krumholzibacteria bacterium]
MTTAVRPLESEYAEYYRRYVSQVPEGDIVATLRSQMEETSRVLGAVPAARTDYRYAPGKWSLHEVVGHVVDMEWVFTARALSFARGLAAPMPGVEQEEFVAAAQFGRQSWPNLLEQWRHLRTATALFYESLDEEAWKRAGIASGYSVSVRALAYITAGHERHHLGVIRERYLG